MVETNALNLDGNANEHEPSNQQPSSLCIALLLGTMPVKLHHVHH